MVAQAEDIRNTQVEKSDCTISFYALGIKRILKDISAYKTNITNATQLPLGKMMRASINKLNANLRKLESIGNDLFSRLKHTKAMGSFSGKDGLIQELEIEIDLFYEMMKVQTQRYRQTLRC